MIRSQRRGNMAIKTRPALHSFNVNNIVVVVGGGGFINRPFVYICWPKSWFTRILRHVLARWPRNPTWTFFLLLILGNFMPDAFPANQISGQEKCGWSGGTFVNLLCRKSSLLSWKSTNDFCCVFCCCDCRFSLENRSKRRIWLA